MSLPPLKVRIGADTTELNSGLDSAQARFAKFAAAAAAAAAAVAAAMGALARQSMKTIDAQAKMASSIGGSVAALQRLQRASDLAGVSQGELEGALTRMTRRISLAADSTGPAVDALDRLGLSARNLNNLDTDERLDTITSRIREMVPAAQQAGIASQIFGDRVGIAITRLDTETINQAAQDIKDFGVAVSQQDAEQIERTNDAISRLSLIWTGLGNRIAVQIAPAMEGLANIIANITKVTGPLSKAFSAIFERIPAYTATIGSLGAVLAGKFVAGLIAARIATLGLVGSLVALRAALIRTGIGAIVVLLGEAAFQFSKLSKAAGGFGEALGAVGDIFREITERFRMGFSLIGELVGGVGMIIQGAFMKAFGAVENAWINLQNKIAEGINVLVNGLNSAFGTNFGTVETAEAGGSSAGGDRLMESGQAIVQSAAGSLMDLSGPLESVQAIRDLLKTMKEEGTTLPDILGVPGGEGGEGGDGPSGAGAGSAEDLVTKRLQGQIGVLQDLKNQARDTWSSMGNFVQQFAGKSKAAAIAAIAVQKGLSIAQIIANTAAAQMRALAELGPIAGPPVAAKIGAYGKVQAALVAATGLAQAANAGSGGSSGGAASSGGGSGGGGGATQAAAPDPPTQTVIIDAPGMDLSSFVHMINKATKEGHSINLRQA